MLKAYEESVYEEYLKLRCAMNLGVINGTTIGKYLVRIAVIEEEYPWFVTDYDNEVGKENEYVGSVAGLDFE